MSDPSARPRLVFANRFYWPDEQATAQLLIDDTANINPAIKTNQLGYLPDAPAKYGP